MASTIITKNSSTASAVPVVGDLTKGELAVNVTDKKIYTKDNSAAVVKLVGSLGNQEANAVAITGGSIAGITDLAVADGGTGASTASDARTNLGLGTIATQAASSVTITGGSVTGITDITVADGGTGASTAANARSNLGAAASGANSDITSLSGLTTALSVAQGGTGITSFGSGVATFLGTPSSANLLAAVTDETGTGALVFANTPTLVAPILGTPTSGNFSTGTFTWPTFNQNTTGTAAGLSSTLAIASGGTGATTAGGALTSLGAYAASNPSGYTSNTGTVTSVGGTGTVNGLTLTGTVTTSGNLTLGGTLSGVSLTSQVSGTLPTANGGTNLTSFTSGGVVYASGTSALATGSALTFSGANLGVGTASASQRVHIYESTAATGAFLQVQEVGGQNAYFGVNTSGGSIQVAGANPLQFAINGSEAMRLTSTSLYTASGINVGIGTSNATDKLTIVGNQKITGYIELRSANKIYFDDSGNTAAGAIWNGGTAGGLSFGGDGSTQHMILNNSGNLGLGTPPSAWGSDFKAMEYANGMFVGNFPATATTFVGLNAYYNAGWKFKANGYANYYEQYNGQHQWHTSTTSNSSGAGATASFTQAATLTAGGNFIVGKTADSGYSIQSKGGALDGQTNTTVSTSATTIYTTPNSISGNACFIYGDNGSEGFMDLVFFVQGNSPVVVSSQTIYGTPSARTYTSSGSALRLAFVSGTYGVRTGVLGAAYS